MTNAFEKELANARGLLERGEYQESLDIVNMLATGEEIKDSLTSVEFMILKAEISWRSGKLDQGLESVEIAEDMLISEKLKQMESEKDIMKATAALCSHAGVIHWYSGNLDRALEYHQQCLKIKENLRDKPGISATYNNLGLVFWSKGNIDQATEFYKKSLEICQDLNDEYCVSRVLNNLANISASKGELDEALEYHQRSLSIKERISSKQEIAMSLINIGVIFRLKGNLDQATEYYNRSLAKQEDLSIGPEFALALHNLGEIFSLKGEVVLALEFYQRSLLIYEDMGNKEGIALTLNNIGNCHMRRGNPEIAFEYYQRSLAISEDMGNTGLIASILRELVWLALDGDDSKLANEYLSKLEQVNKVSDSSVVNQQYLISQALVLKRSGRTRDRVKAEEILEEVIEKDISDHTLTVAAMIHLCDLLLIELKATGDEETLDKVRNLTQRLVIIAQEQASHPLLVETYLLQSKLAVVAFEFKQAHDLMERAKQLADEKGLVRLAHIVENEVKLLNHQQKRWETILDQNPSKQEMIDLTNLTDLLERMVQKTVETLGLESVSDQKQAKYQLVHHDLLIESRKTERSNYRVGIAQIGLSHSGDILNELYEEKGEGLIGLKDESIKSTRIKVREMVNRAHIEGVNILIFPEMSIDLSFKELQNDIEELAMKHEMIIIPGSFHNQESKGNLSRIIGPDGLLWEQEKHTPAIIHIEGKRFIEKIETSSVSKKTIICNTEFGRIAITICRDFLDMDLRVELKNSEPPVDLIINPAFTPVTADFKAAHFDARRSIYAYCFFANIAEFGDSLIYSPEKDRIERTLPAGEEGLIVKDVDLFQLRSERKKWEKQTQKSFIQSTRN